MQTETNTSREGPVTLIHHAANCDRQAPSNSLSAIRDEKLNKIRIKEQL